jgi:hypothetical protein
MNLLRAGKSEGAVDVGFGVGPFATEISLSYLLKNMKGLIDW